MDSEEFRIRGKEMVDYLCEYMETLHTRRVTPSVEPGYLRPLLPSEAPHDPEPWEKIMDDVNKHIMPGVSLQSSQSQQLLLFRPKILNRSLFYKNLA
jgi:aromatic-L-amino-acid decarboxylase